MTFMEKLKHSSQVNRSLVCVGLDPERTKLPECVREKEHALFEFNRAIIDATADWAERRRGSEADHRLHP